MPSDASVVFDGVRFRHDAASDPIFASLSVHFPRGFTGIVGPNGAGKTTLLRLATGLLVPEQGTLHAPGDAIYCAQRTDSPPAGLRALLEATDKDACALRGRLGVERDFASRWHSLSHGERKRAQIAATLWREPALLAIDEPTNHLDLPSIECLESALADCPCGLLLVSHDEGFLGRLETRRWHIEGDGVRSSVPAVVDSPRRAPEPW